MDPKETSNRPTGNEPSYKRNRHDRFQSQSQPDNDQVQQQQQQHVGFQQRRVNYSQYQYRPRNQVFRIKKPEFEEAVEIKDADTYEILFREFVIHKNIRQYKKQWNVHIHFLENEKSIRFRGTKEKIEAAKRHLNEIIEALRTLKRIDLPQEFNFKILEMKFKSEIQKIEKNNQVTIRFKKYGRPPQITISGKTNDVTAAEQQIQQLLQKISEQTVQEKMNLNEEDFYCLRKDEDRIVKIGTDNLVKIEFPTRISNLNNQYQINLIGLKNDVEKVKKEIDNLRDSKKCEEFINNIELSPTQVQQLSNFFEKWHVKGQYNQQEKQFVISGYKELVLEAKSECFEYLYRSKDISYPQEWDPHQTQNSELKLVSEGSDEWNKVVTRIMQTIPQVNIVKIERVQNKKLWETYYQNKIKMQMKNRGQATELQLFHGTHPHDPSLICNGEDGFDMRFSIEGSWGKGLYFSENASYSHKYAYQGTDRKKLLLASVLVGDFVQLQPDNNLRMPPEKPKRSDTLGASKERYDSVKGQNKEIYVLYTNGHAYPSYLITYTCLVKFEGLSSREIEIPLSDLILLEIIGEGAYGKVYKGTYKGKTVAIKKLKIKSNFTEEELSKNYSLFRKEIEILKMLNHPNVLKLIGVCVNDFPRLYIITEYCNGGSLFDLLHKKKTKLSTQQQIEIALRIAEGMEYLHSHSLGLKIVHRDLKSLNILLHDGVPKIIDFGVSQTKGPYTTALHTQAGTANWMAPEVMKDEGYTEKADVWSFGMVLYELTTNTIPYSDCNNPMQIKDKLENEKTPSIPNENEIDSTLRELMKQCWNWDPQQRPSFTQIVQTLKKYSSDTNSTSQTASTQSNTQKETTSK